jgi:pimeloyl-ACP methyl ester carboxylesterase
VSAADADEFARRIDGARVVSLDATHNVQETAPVALAALLAQTAPTGGI